MDKNDVGAGYIPLKAGDIVQGGDQRYVDFCWVPVPKSKIGKPLVRLHWPMRRKAAVGPEVPETPKKPVDPGPGYRLLEVGETKPMHYEIYGEVDGAWLPGDYPGTTRMPGQVPMRVKLPEAPAQTLDAILHAEIVDPRPPQPVPYLKEAVQEAIATSSEIRAEWIPKPFTPNKYTRELLALDGRMVPVDVYSVSGAFALAPVIQNEEVLDALFHARKKILAPGQRGAKGVLQDLKEARQSLDRAIRVMEEG